MAYLYFQKHIVSKKIVSKIKQMRKSLDKYQNITLVLSTT